MNNLSETKKQLSQAIRILHKGNILTLAVGHASCRLDGDRILMLGHVHKHDKTLDNVTEDDLIIIDFDGNVLDGNYKPPGEFYIHTEVYRKNSSIKSIVHGHPELCIAISVSGKKMFPVHYRAGAFFPEVPVLNYSGQIDTKELGIKTADAMTVSKGLLLKGHGIVVVGDSIEESVINSFSLETNARIQHLAMQIGDPVPLDKDQLGRHNPTSMWAYYVNKYDK